MTIYLPYECFYNMYSIQERYLIDVFHEKEDAKKAIADYIESLDWAFFDPNKVDMTEEPNGNLFWTDEDNRVIAYLKQRVLK